MNKAKNKLFHNLTVSGDCVLYSGTGTGKGGYGRITWYENGQRLTVSAHRLAYTLHRGPIAPGMVIRHTCHNPRCVNPDHLIQGTHAQNSRDMVNAGRSLKRYGSKNPNARLTDQQRDDIKTQRQEGATLKFLAGKYGVHLSTIWHVCRPPKKDKP